MPEKGYLTDDEINTFIADGNARALGDAIKKFRKRNPEVGAWLYLKRIGLGGLIIALPFAGDALSPIKRIENFRNNNNKAPVAEESKKDADPASEHISLCKREIMAEIGFIEADIREWVADSFVTEVRYIREVDRLGAQIEKLRDRKD